MNQKQRNKNRATSLALSRVVPQHTWECVNCAEQTTHRHFFPPCTGDEGFFICKTKEKQT